MWSKDRGFLGMPTFGSGAFGGQYLILELLRCFHCVRACHAFSNTAGQSPTFMLFTFGLIQK